MLGCGAQWAGRRVMQSEAGGVLESWWGFVVTVQLLSCYNSLWPHGLQQARLPSPSPSPGVCSNSCPLSRWCRPIISSSVIPFSSCPQSFPASGFFPVSWLFASGGQSIGASTVGGALAFTEVSKMGSLGRFWAKSTWIWFSFSKDLFGCYVRLDRGSQG